RRGGRGLVGGGLRGGEGAVQDTLGRDLDGLAIDGQPHAGGDVGSHVVDEGVTGGDELVVDLRGDLRVHADHGRLADLEEAVAERVGDVLTRARGLVVRVDRPDPGVVARALGDDVLTG